MGVVINRYEKAMRSPLGVTCSCGKEGMDYDGNNQWSCTNCGALAHYDGSEYEIIPENADIFVETQDYLLLVEINDYGVDVDNGKKLEALVRRIEVS